MQSLALKIALSNRLNIDIPYNIYVCVCIVSYMKTYSNHK